MKRMISKSLMALAMVSVMGSATAAQKDITVTANVDAALEMTQSDGSALPKSIEMQYFPGTGLAPYSLMTKIWSNDVSKDVKMKLVSDFALVNNIGGTSVPMTVKWGNSTLTTTDTTLTAAELFPNTTEAVKTGSVSKELKISQATQSALTTGVYQGVVSIYLYQ